METVKLWEHRIHQLIQLKHTLELTEPLREALASASAPLLVTYRDSLRDARFQVLLTKMTERIHPDTSYQKGILSMRMQKIFAVKPGISGLLDVARRTYTETVDDIQRPS